MSIVKFEEKRTINVLVENKIVGQIRHIQHPTYGYGW